MHYKNTMEKYEFIKKNLCSLVTPLASLQKVKWSYPSSTFQWSFLTVPYLVNRRWTWACFRRTVTACRCRQVGLLSLHTNNIFMANLIENLNLLRNDCFFKFWRSKDRVTCNAIAEICGNDNNKSHKLSVRFIERLPSIMKRSCKNYTTRTLTEINILVGLYPMNYWQRPS